MSIYNQISTRHNIGRESYQSYPEGFSQELGLRLENHGTKPGSVLAIRIPILFAVRSWFVSSKIDDSKYIVI